MLPQKHFINKSVTDMKYTNPDHLIQLIQSLTKAEKRYFRLYANLQSGEKNYLFLFDLINKDCAACIYTGMMTDTGSFTYNSNKPEIYTIVSELIKKGIDKDLIYRKVNQVYSECRLRMMGYVLYEKMRVYPEQQAALITLSKEELDRFQYQAGDTEGFVNLPLSIENVSFSVFIREDSDYIKVSLRSVGDFPCNQFASTYFNGGGHKNASGGEFYGSLSEAVAVFEKGLQEFNPNKSEDLGKHA